MRYSAYIEKYKKYNLKNNYFFQTRKTSAMVKKQNFISAPEAICFILLITFLYEEVPFLTFWK